MRLLNKFACEHGQLQLIFTNLSALNTNLKSEKKNHRSIFEIIGFLIFENSQKR